LAPDKGGPWGLGAGGGWRGAEPQLGSTGAMNVRPSTTAAATAASVTGATGAAAPAATAFDGLVSAMDVLVAAAEVQTAAARPPAARPPAARPPAAGFRVGDLVEARCGGRGGYHMGYGRVCARPSWKSPRHVPVMLDGELDESYMLPELVKRVAAPSIKVQAAEWLKIVEGDLRRRRQHYGQANAGKSFLCCDLTACGNTFQWIVPYDSDEAPWRGMAVENHDGRERLVVACYGSYTSAESGITVHAVRCAGEPPRYKRRCIPAGAGAGASAGAGAGAGAGV
jgi:hypothetical protein